MASYDLNYIEQYNCDHNNHDFINFQSLYFDHFTGGPKHTVDKPKITMEIDDKDSTHSQCKTIVKRSSFAQKASLKTDFSVGR